MLVSGKGQGTSLVLFRDGTSGRFAVHRYDGACFTGDPTAYVYRNGVLTWVRPGESVSWVEAEQGVV